MGKILVGIDFSPEAEHAARQALAIARHTGDEIVLVHAGGTVELPPLDDDELSAGSKATYRSLVAASLASDRGRLGALREALSGQGPTVSQLVIEGFPDTELCTAARELGAAMLVVGTHGRTGWRWFFLGSTAQRVVRLAETDVLVARRGEPPLGGFRRVLVATDFTPAADHALARALALAAPDAEIDVVHCHRMAPSLGVDPEIPDSLDALNGQVAAHLQAKGERMVASRGSGRQTLRFHLVETPAIAGLVHWLESHPIDLAALGSHGRRGLRRFVLGSVAESVVRHAPCSVLVGHPRLA